jgi:uncharacterized protein (DUF983 family)
MNQRGPVNPGAPIGKALGGHCPRCGEGRLFDGFLGIAEACGRCGLKFDFVDSADGPAVFVILIAGFIVTGAALIVEILYQPPYWVHAALWLPLGILLPLAMLRPLKGWLIWMQYRHDAKQAQFDEDGEEV